MTDFVNLFYRISLGSHRMLRHPIRVGCRLGSISSLRSRRSIGILARTSNLFASEQQQPQQRKQTETSEKNTSSASQEAPNEKPSSGLSMFAKLKQYGPVGLLIYLTIHSIGFWITFCAVYCGFPVCVSFFISFFVR